MLEAQLREMYGKVVYTHKTHEKCADILNKLDSRIKIIQIGLSSLTSASVLSAILSDEKFLQFVSLAISVILTFLTAYLKNFDPKGLAEKHSQAAIKLWNIRESYLSLLVDFKIESCDVKLSMKRRDELQASLFAVFKEVPRTFSSAYNNASKALKHQEELTFSDDEIDAFLPVPLRKNK